MREKEQKMYCRLYFIYTIRNIGTVLYFKRLKFVLEKNKADVQENEKKIFLHFIFLYFTRENGKKIKFSDVILLWCPSRERFIIYKQLQGKVSVSQNKALLLIYFFFEKKLRFPKNVLVGKNFLIENFPSAGCPPVRRWGSCKQVGWWTTGVRLRLCSLFSNLHSRSNS